MKIRNLKLNKPLTWVGVGIIVLVCLLILKIKGYINKNIVIASAVFIITVVVYLFYLEYKNQDLDTVFNTHSHIYTLDALNIFRRAYEGEYGVKIKKIEHNSKPFLDEFSGDQVVGYEFETVKGERFSGFIPLDRGRKTIEKLDVTIHRDRTPTFRKKEEEMFAKRSRKDLLQSQLRALPEELHAQVIKQNLVKEENEEKKEVKEDGENNK